MRAVTRNLACRSSADRWVRQILAAPDTPDLAFLQEVPAALLAAPPAGYQAVSGRERPSSAVGRTSLLLVRDGVGELGEPTDITFEAMGTYVATAVLRRGDTRTLVVSAHTSPAVVAEDKRRPDFGTRSCERGPWWTDAFLADLRLVMAAVDTPVLIAGDFNQARAYDAAHGHRCGGEFLDAVADLGLVDVTVRDWGGERATRRSPDYHLDRVFASRQLAEEIRVDDIELVDDSVSDHAAVWFSRQG
jgi:hypothetical protein